MTFNDSFLQHWYFHVPNLVLAAMIYSIIARYILELIFRSNPGAVILTVFRQVTDPVLKVVRAVTPAVIPNGLVIVLAIVWLMGLRMFWLLTVLASGVKLVQAA